MRGRIVGGLALCALLVVGAVVAQEALSGPGLDSIRDAMADRDYAGAARRVTEFLERRPKGEDAEEARVLLVRAKLGLGDFEGALVAGRRFLSDHRGSTWERKIRFLMGEAFARMRGFKEAAEIYREQVDFLSGDLHERKVAGYYRALADQAYEGLEKRDEFGRKKVVKDFPRALAYYVKARGIHVDESDAPLLTHRIADCRYQMKKHRAAIAEWKSLLEKWPGSEWADEATYFVGLSLHELHDEVQARRYLRETREKFGDSEWAPLALIALSRTHRLSDSSDEAEIDRALKYLKLFRALHPSHEKAEEVFFGVGAIEYRAGRYDAAIAEFTVYLEKFPDGEKSPLARDRIANCRYKQNDFDGAIEEWKTFLGTWPNHELWTKVQGMIAQAAFEKGHHPFREAEKAEEKRKGPLYEKARRGFRGFLVSYPVDERVSEAQYLLGEIEHRSKAYAKALTEWDVVKTKYPRTEWAARAMFRIAGTYEKDLDDLEKAIGEYEELVTRYPASGEARTAGKLLGQFREKLLEVVTERTYRTDEPLEVKLRTRNIESLTLRAYRVDMEEIFRQKKVFGGIESILVEVVKPEKTKGVETASYEKYRLFDRDLELPLSGPGAWILKLEEDDLTATTLVVVSDLTIVTKQSPRQTVVFAVNARTGAPWPNVNVLIRNGRTLFEGRTGDDGTLVRTRRQDAGRVKVFAEANSSVAGTDLSALGGATFGYATKIYLHTDRPLYRPGDEVHVKGIYRKVGGGVYLTPAGETLDVEIRDPRDTVIFKEKVKTNDYGTFSRSTRLPETAALGAYKILAVTKDEKSFAGTFAVEEFKKPEFTITCRTDRRTYLPGETVKAKLALRYFFGGAVPKTKVRYRLFRGPYSFDAAVHDEFAWFTRDPERERERRRRETAGLTVMKEGEVRTDADGNAEITFPAEDVDEDRRYILAFEALDLNRQWVRESKAVVVARQGFFALARTERKVYRPGEEIEVRLTTVDGIHFPVSLTGELQVVRRSFDGNREVESIVSRKSVTTGEDGRAAVKVEVALPGEYRLKLVAEDRAGNRVAGSALVTIAGEAEDLARHARVVASRQIYREGEEAEILVNSPLAPAWALLTFEGERVLDHRVIRLTERSTTLTIPMKAEYSPNIFVKIAIPDREKLNEAGDEVYVFKYLEVNLVPERPEVSPGEKVSFLISTTDQRGNPVAAELGLALVDRAILALQPDLAEQIKPFFYDQRRKLAVATGSSLAFRYTGITHPTDKEVLREILRRKDPEKFNRTMKYVQDGKGFLDRGDLDSAAIEFKKALRISPDNYEARSCLTRTEARIEKKMQLERLAKLASKAEEREEWDSDELGEGGGTGAAHGGRRASRPGFTGGPAEDAKRKFAPSSPANRARHWDGSGSDDALPEEPSADAPHPGAFFGKDSEGDFRGRKENLYDKALPILGERPLAGYLFQQTVLPPTLRKNFADIAAWLPHVVTGPDGKAKVSIDLPDNLTTWRAVARGVTKATLVGEATSEIVAKKDLLVRLDTPRFLTQHDEVTITSTVHNNLGEPLAVAVDVKGENITILSPDETEATLGPGKIRRFDWRAVAESQGTATLTGQALSEVESDSARTGLPVLPHGLRTLVGRSGEVGEEAVLAFTLPDGIIPGTKNFLLTLSPGLDGSILESAVYLGGFPYGCLEQTVNRFLPAIAVDQALRAIRSPDAALKDKLRAAVEQGLLALYAFQNPDGSFGWFSGLVRRVAADRKTPKRGGDPVMTALALLGMERAREAGYRVSERHRSLAIRAGRSLVKTTSGYAEKAMLLFALARGGAANLEDLNQVYRYRDGLGAHALSTLALAMHRTKRSYNAVALVRLLKTKAVTKEGLTYWPGTGRHGVMNDVETTAYALRALLAVEPGGDLARGAVRWLMVHKKGPRWTSTRDTGAAVLALAEHLLAEGVERCEYTIDVYLNDGEAPYQKIKVEGGRVAQDRERFVIIDGARLRAGENRIKLVKRGVGPLFYTMLLNYHVAADEIEPAGNLIGLDRRYTEYVSPLAAGEGTEEIKPGWTIVRPEARPKDDPGTTIERAGSGDKFRVRLTITAREDLPYVIVEDRLPAGVEVVAGQSTGPFDWEERRDEKQVFFLTDIPKGEVELTYLVQAIHPGRYHAMPAFAYPMYEPAIWGRSGMNELTIVPVSGVAGRTTAPEAITPDELYQLAARDYKAERFEAVQDGLERLLENFRLLDKYQEACHAVLLRVAFELEDDRRAVEAYERLTELNPRRGPKTTEERRKLANAYQGIGEHERALSLLKGVTDEYLGRELEVAETYRTIGNPYRAQVFTELLLRAYPDSNAAVDQFLRTARRYLDLKVPEGVERPRRDTGTETGLMLPEALDAFHAFLGHYPESPLADEACRMAVTVLGRMEDPAAAVVEADKFIRRYRNSPHLDDVTWYLTESYFNQEDYDRAMTTGRILLQKRFRLRAGSRETGPSPFIPHVYHLFAKIHHLRGELEKAVPLYRKVASKFEDARDALAFLTRKELDVPETSSFGVGEPVKLTLGRKNLTEMELRIYPVDLMFLIAVKKDLRAANEIDLTGIATTNRLPRSFPTGKDHRWHEEEISLPVTEKGVYLVVAKSKELQKSSIVIVSDLEIKVQVVGSKVRVYATGRETKQPMEKVFVKISDGKEIRAQGFTDARGVFEGRGVSGSVMVVAEADGHYALYRR